MLAWLALPVVPAVLETLHYEVVNVSSDGHGGPDPFGWDWFRWLMLLGPLVGFGFLAGATLDLPDDPPPRRWRDRRAVWVAVGPWTGLLTWGVAIFVIMLLNMTLPQLADIPLGQWWKTRAAEWLQSLVWVVSVVFVVATLCYAWVVPALAALRRARRRGRLRRVLLHGLAVTIAFIGSLLGGFWAIVQAWRTYFFDKAIVPFVLAACALAACSGCGTPVTYGDVRRRELFEALLVSWVFGLGVLWRWWSRPRRKP